ncbi:tetratricopeptide repeat protein [Salinicola aestuarinus]|uniref:tetratricopeptide repeat protein n=1 Tax=Salinicola aestuarinus TaxID=1949082 RepID=UPI0013007CE8|nr:tetratricopeptide repeat protein [Salinicola aestuarinus]
MKKIVFSVFLMFLSSLVEADVLYQDPTGASLNEAFDQLSEDEVKNVSTGNVAKKEYMLGMLNLNGDDEFHVEQNCEKAVSLLTSSSEAGVADAQHALATMYYHGVCVEKNIEKSRELATQSAEKGYILSQRMLGLAYVGEKWDELVSYDVDQGVFWLSEAGNAGDRVSAGELSYMYDKGDKVPEDKEVSFSWLKKAVFNKFEKRNRIGFRALAGVYETGDGTDVDLVQAYKYYDLMGTAGAKGKQRIADQMTQAQIDEAVRQSQAWQEEHNVQIGGGFIRRAN